MKALDPFRRELRALLGPLPMLRRDRTMRALFVCDAPRHPGDTLSKMAVLKEAGYTVSPEKGMWLLDLAPARRAAYIESLLPGRPPEDMSLRSLCRSLLSAAEADARNQPWEPIRSTLLYLDADDMDGLKQMLRTDTALRKRMHAPLPAAAAYIIEENIERMGSSC